MPQAILIDLKYYCITSFPFSGRILYQEEKGDIRRQEKNNKNRDTGVQTDDAKI